MFAKSTVRKIRACSYKYTVYSVHSIVQTVHLLRFFMLTKPRYVSYLEQNVRIISQKFTSLAFGQFYILVLNSVHQCQVYKVKEVVQYVCTLLKYIKVIVFSLSFNISGRFRPYDQKSREDMVRQKSGTKLFIIHFLIYQKRYFSYYFLELKKKNFKFFFVDEYVLSGAMSSPTPSIDSLNGALAFCDNSGIVPFLN